MRVTSEAKELKGSVKMGWRWLSQSYCIIIKIEYVFGGLSQTRYDKHRIPPSVINIFQMYLLICGCSAHKLPQPNCFHHFFPKVMKTLLRCSLWGTAQNMQWLNSIYTLKESVLISEINYLSAWGMSLCWLGNHQNIRFYKVEVILYCIVTIMKLPIT